MGLSLSPTLAKPRELPNLSGPTQGGREREEQEWEGGKRMEEKERGGERKTGREKEGERKKETSLWVRQGCIGTSPSPKRVSYVNSFV